jgi:hypothetical protein
MVAVTCDIDDDAPPGNEIVHIDGTTGKLTTIQRNFTAWATNSGDIGYSGGASNRTSTLYMATRENPRTERLTMVGYSASTAAVVSTSPRLAKALTSLYASHYDSSSGRFFAIEQLGAGVVFVELLLTTGASTGRLPLNVSWSFEFCIGSDAFDEATGVLHQLLLPDGAQEQVLVSAHVRGERAGAAPRIVLTKTNIGADDFLLNPTISGGVLYGFDANLRLGTLAVADGVFALFPRSTGLRSAMGDAFGHAIVSAGVLFISNSTEWQAAGQRHRQLAARAVAAGHHVRMPPKPEPQPLLGKETSKNSLCTYSTKDGALLRCVKLARPIMYMFLTSPPE